MSKTLARALDRRDQLMVALTDLTEAVEEQLELPERTDHSGEAVAGQRIEAALKLAREALAQLDRDARLTSSPTAEGPGESLEAARRRALRKAYKDTNMDDPDVVR